MKQKENKEELEKVFEAEIQNLLVVVPNIPNLTVPLGKTPEENEVVLEHGAKPNLPAGSVPHWEDSSCN